VGVVGLGRHARGAFSLRESKKQCPRHGDCLPANAAYGRRP
jgi:hypothetical protein